MEAALGFSQNEACSPRAMTSQWFDRLVSPPVAGFRQEAFQRHGWDSGDPDISLSSWGQATGKSEPRNPPDRMSSGPHIWLWFLGGSLRLPKGLTTLIQENSDQCWLSPISIWELGVLVDRGRLTLDTSQESWGRSSLEKLPLREAPLTRDVALGVHSLQFEHRDPADQFLAATAHCLDLTLLTVDSRLTALTWLSTRSK